MAVEDLVDQFARVSVWKRDEERAPHKPLLILYALGRWVSGDQGPVPFAEVDRDLRDLLSEFGPSRAALHPEYPFVRLERDEGGLLWHVTADGPMQPRLSNTDPKRSELLSKNARGEFGQAVKAALTADETLAARIADAVLAAHFPESIHDSLRTAVGLESASEAAAPAPARASRTVAVRDPRFRALVLDAYGHQCAVCGFGVILGRSTIGLEAAHIRWHTHGGPALTDNGLALCRLHHSLLDHGAFTLQERVVLVSDKARGPEVEPSLYRHHGKPYRQPTHARQAPRAEHLAWHRKNVFKGDARP